MIIYSYIYIYEFLKRKLTYTPYIKVYKNISFTWSNQPFRYKTLASYERVNVTASAIAHKACLITSLYFDIDSCLKTILTQVNYELKIEGRYTVRFRFPFLNNNIHTPIDPSYQLLLRLIVNVYASFNRPSELGFALVKSYLLYLLNLIYYTWWICEKIRCVCGSWR